MQREPNKHHFLPVFYLKRWTGHDGRVTQYSRPYKQIKALRRHPEAVGYVTRLYAVEGLPSEIANAMESEFLSPVDSRAADALDRMTSCEVIDLSAAQRTAWSQFVGSLLTRMPDDVIRLRNLLQLFMDDFIPHFQEIYEIFREETSPESFSQLMSDSMRKLSAEKSLKLIREVTVHPQLSNAVSQLDWRVRVLKNSRNELLTSDRPVIFTRNAGDVRALLALKGPDAHLVVPIGPRALFMAASPAAMKELMNASDDGIAQAVNISIVGNATRCVFGCSDIQLRFVQNRFGSIRDQTITDLAQPIYEKLKNELDDFKLPIDMDVMREVAALVRSKGWSRLELEAKLNRALLV